MLESGLFVTCPMTCGQLDDYLFVPNEITHTEILSIIGDESEYEESRSSGFKTDACLCGYIDKTLQLLSRVPWLGYVESFPDLTCFLLLCKAEEQTIINTVSRQLREKEMAYRILKYKEKFQVEEYGRWAPLPFSE